MTFVETLEPTALWRHFDKILEIPRGSKEEDRMRRHVITIAQRNDLAYLTDDAGNLVVRKPATPGCEDAAVTILQGHLDMVNEKNSDVEHDFAKDPISPVRAGDYVTADGTTLGSDNGVGVAAMLALMETQDLVHGPLELLFTVDEETGLTGASRLDPSMLQGRRLINLDSEEEGAVYVGCAGGADSNLMLALATVEPATGSVLLNLHLHGLKGGHSGVDIHLQRGNAIKLLARALYAASFGTPFRLTAFAGGNKHNAIPREATATVSLDAQHRERFTSVVEREMAAATEELRSTDPGIKLDLSEGVAPDGVWDESTGLRVLRLLSGLPHGVLAMSLDIPELVETSTNLATVVEQEGSLVIGLSSRSSVDSALEAVCRQIQAIGELAGATVERGNAYPGWRPNLESPLLDVVKRVHAATLGREPEIKAIHAGLECGIIGEKVAGMDMISFGPQIEFPHSPDERVKIDSVARFYDLLTATLEALARSD